MPRKSFIAGCPLVACESKTAACASTLKRPFVALRGQGEAGPAVNEPWNKSTAFFVLFKKRNNKKRNNKKETTKKKQLFNVCARCDFCQVKRRRKPVDP